MVVNKTTRAAIADALQQLHCASESAQGEAIKTLEQADRVDRTDVAQALQVEDTISNEEALRLLSNEHGHLQNRAILEIGVAGGGKSTS